jgi:NRPS condensation-like uncharacterized protein
MMPDNIYKYERKVTAMERTLFLSPFSTVTVVARIKGKITVDMLMNAVEKVQQRHANLRVRIKWDDENNPWFTSEDVNEIPVEIISRESENHWKKVHHEKSQIPFRFIERPAVRLILMHSPEISELIILCHHIICDGLSLAYLARDLMVHMGDPAKEAEILPDPIPIDLNNLPRDISVNPVVKFFINRINKGWRKEKVNFDMEDYRNINETYWLKAQHRMLVVELSEFQTEELVTRCREEKTKVNSALTAAFLGAQRVVQGNRKELTSIGIGGNLRGRIRKPAGEGMGYFASAVTLDHSYDENKGFWDNARRLNRKVQPLYTNKNLFKEVLTWCLPEPGIFEAINFKRLGGFVPAHFSRHEKLSAFSKRDDVVSSILRREKMETLDRIIMGTAVTNLTRMGFLRIYGDLELDRLIFHPGGAFPLSNVNLVLGAVTCSGKLSLVVVYEEGTVDTDTMIRIKDKAIGFLLQ